MTDKRAVNNFRPNLKPCYQKISVAQGHVAQGLVTLFTSMKVEKIGVKL